MIQKLKRHWPIVLIIAASGFYLSVKAAQNGWDGWRVGSAQTLLSAEHWVKDGFFQSRFLFLPQGYSKSTRYFDDPELRQHAEGIATGGFIGKRLYYTHYPSGYSLPTALMMKFGVENRFWFRFLQILFSLCGLALLYRIFLKISSSRPIAFLGTIYFAASVLFLDYADSLANQPIDLLLRFAIVAASFGLAKKRDGKLNFIIWILYFILSISSYDSTFFVFAWLVGMDFIISKKIEWKKILFWASAPLAAFSVQIIQNLSYLGWHDMFLDFFGAFKIQILGARKDFVFSHIERLFDPFGWFFGVKWFWGILISLAGIAAVKFFKKAVNALFDEKFLYLAFFASVFNFLFFPSLFFYQAGIVSIFGGLLIGCLTVWPVKAFAAKNLKPAGKILAAAILAGILIIWVAKAQRTYAYAKRWPNNVWPREKIDFDKKMKNIVSGDKIIFKLYAPSGGGRYPASAAEDEYYADAPILGFTAATDLARDFDYLKKISRFPFAAVIVADKKESLLEIKKKLNSKNPVSEIGGYAVLIIN